MKFSEVDLDFVKEYLRIEQDWTEDDTELELFINAGKSYIYEISCKDDDYLDTQDFAVVVLMMLINDWYTNKIVVTTGTNVKVNPLFDRMLDRLRGYKL